MKIEDHRLVDGDVTQLTTLVAPKITPEVVVIHYGVTHTLDALVADQKARGLLGTSFNRRLRGRGRCPPPRRWLRRHRPR